MSDSFPSQPFATPHELPQPGPVARPEPASMEQTIARPSVDVAPTKGRRPDSHFRNQQELVDGDQANEEFQRMASLKTIRRPQQRLTVASNY